MTTNIEITESDVKQLVFEHLNSKFPELGITPKDVKVTTKSKNNFRPQEWEEAAFRVSISKTS